MKTENDTGKISNALYSQEALKKRKKNRVRVEFAQRRRAAFPRGRAPPDRTRQFFALPIKERKESESKPDFLAPIRGPPDEPAAKIRRRDNCATVRGRQLSA